jgi:di/tricarboxylate transporter
MVQAPGGYRFTDFMRIGLPLGILTGAVAVAAIALQMTPSGVQP